MSQDNILVAITASREKEEIVYRLECSSDLSKEEFEYYLGEIIKGLCEWNKAVCEESMRSFEGRIKQRKNKALRSQTKIKA